ncbi:flagellar basal body rod protein FlgB [Spartinivicinus ruber]|uniref:flagellar basal body rod protein FlgB n=1 Tax=Spartinivicinus ruber TaxID=2683272 RepID=UPI0013D747C8|nr:hypothetical protein [Spartinivicinus ruber]
MEIFTETITEALINKMLDRSVLEHKLIANNVANVNTKNYVPLTTKNSETFEAILASFEEQAEEVRQSQLKSIVKDWDITAEIAAETNKDTVAIDDEMAKLSMNTLHYQALLRAKSELKDLMTVAVQGVK